MILQAYPSNKTKKVHIKVPSKKSTAQMSYLFYKNPLLPYPKKLNPDGESHPARDKEALRVKVEELD